MTENMLVKLFDINSMLSALGVTPPSLDGWTYGEVTNALIPISTYTQRGHKITFPPE